MDEVASNETVNVLDPLDHLPEPQRTSAKKLRYFVRALETVRPPSKHGDLFVGRVDRRGLARVQMFVREGIYEAKTIVVEFPVLQTDYRTMASRLADEYAELHKALFLMTFAPDLYNGDVSPVEVSEARTVKSMEFM